MDVDFLNEAFSYEPDTGRLFWKWRPGKHFSDEAVYRRWNTRWACQPALTAKASNGCLVGRISGEMVRAHRVVWALHHGEWPSSEIDHIDGNPANNAVSNLRLATRAQNLHNRRMYKNNRSGFKGVSYVPHTREKWEAQIRANGGVYRLGRFKTPEEAAAAYAQASQRLHGQFSNSS